MRASRQRRRCHRLVQRVRRQDLDEVEVRAQQLLEVARRYRPRVLARAAGEQSGIAIAQRGDLRLGMVEVAAHVEIEYAPEADKTDAQLTCHAGFLHRFVGGSLAPTAKGVSRATLSVIASAAKQSSYPRDSHRHV